MYKSSDGYYITDHSVDYKKNSGRTSLEKETLLFPVKRFPIRCTTRMKICRLIFEKYVFHTRLKNSDILKIIKNEQINKNIINAGEDPKLIFKILFDTNVKLTNLKIKCVNTNNK